jgi:aminoglycoside phosphotransferase (APT) family kinase protein
MTWNWSLNELFALERFLADMGLCHGPLTGRQIGEGHSNLTFLVGDGRRSVIVRRPPPPPMPPGAHDVVREAQVMAALRNTPVPVPDVLAIAQPGEVLDVPMVVMSCVDGPVITTRTPEPFCNDADRRLIGNDLVDVLADLHAVDWRQCGLADFGRPDGFNQRHLHRIARLIADGAGQLPTEFEALFTWLTSTAPAESGHTVVHNDFRLGNVIVGVHPPARIAAVLDWELATIGDPLFDLAYLLASIPVDGQPVTPTEAMGSALLEPGYPSRFEMAERYAAITGRDITGLSWYIAAVYWKLAVLYEYGRRRNRRGGDPYFQDPANVQAFLAAAFRAAGHDVCGSLTT